jgi:hypothetical protein
MPETEVQGVEPARSSAACRRVLRRIPRKLRVSILTGLVLLLGFVIYTVASAPSATLNLICRHNFRNAELSVFIDGKLDRTESISGIAKKRFGLFDTRIEGTFSKSIAVPAGEHVLQVRVKSAADSFDQSKQCGINIGAGKDATVIVSAQRSGMTLAYSGPPPSATMEGSGYFSYLRTVAATVFGSIVSAAIGFVVQDFMRARKVSLPVQNQNS